MFNRKPRVVAALITICMLLSLITSLCLPVTADPGAIEISNASQWADIADNLNGNYILTNDIDFRNVSDYTPIGNGVTPFTGTLNGNGHTIKNLTLQTNKNYVGLFGVNNGTISKLYIDDSCSFSGNAYVGAIAGVNNGTIEDCGSNATVTSVSAGTDYKYKILTQNLCDWGDRAGLKEALLDSFSFSDVNYDSRRPGMLTRFEDANADILLFQEVGFNRIKVNGLLHSQYIQAWSDYLDENLMGDGTLIPGRNYQHLNELDEMELGAEQGVFLVYDENKFDLVENGYFWLNEKDPNQRLKYGASTDTPNDDADSYRICHWALLKDRTTDQLIAVYSIHLDFDSKKTVDDVTYNIKANTGGAQVIKEHLAALKEKYPEAIFVAAGDYNATKGREGYAVIDEVLEDTRYLADADEFAENQSTATHTYIGSFIDTTNDQEKTIYDGMVAGRTVDHIMVSGDFLDVTEFEVLNDMYNASGVNVFDPDGKDIEEVTHSVTSSTISQYVGATGMNPSDHNGVSSTITPINEEYVGGLAGKNTGTVELVSEEYVEAYAKAVSDVTEPVTHGDFKIESIDDWMWVFEHHAEYFTGTDIDVHLLCDIDLSDAKASAFTGFKNAKFSFNGHGNTISNWGTKNNPVVATGLFYVKNGEDGGMNFLKNFRLVNCHNTATASPQMYTALVYAPACGNGGNDYLPTEFTMENIQVRDSSHISTGEVSGILLSKYGSKKGENHVTIKNCQVVNTIHDLSVDKPSHHGTVVGKIVNTTKKIVYDISDIFIRNTEINNAGTGVGIVIGTVEHSNATARLTNIGVFNSTVNSSDDAALVGYSDDGATTLTNCLFAGNTLNSETGTTYLMAESYGPNNLQSLTNVYCDNTLSGTAEGTELTHNAVTNADVLSGKIPYELNQQLASPSFYWKKGSDCAIPATEAEQVCKIKVVSASGAVTYAADDANTYYVNGGEKIDLSQYATDTAMMVTTGNGTIVNNVLTASTNGDTTVTVYGEDDVAYPVVKEIARIESLGINGFENKDEVSEAVAAAKARVIAGSYNEETAAADAAALSGYTYTPSAIAVNIIVPEKVTPGESFTVALNLENNNSDVAAMNVGVAYDNTLMNLTKIEKGPLFDYFMGGTGFVDDGSVPLTFINATNVEGNGTFAYLTFTASAELTASSLPIRVDIIDEPFSEDGTSVTVVGNTATVPVFYPPLLVVDASQNNIKAGETFTVDVLLDNNADVGITMMNLKLTYDNSLLSLTNIENGGLFSHVIGGSGFADDGSVILQIANFELVGGTYDVGDGKVLTLTFTAAEELMDSEAVITAETVNSSVINNDSALNTNGEYIPVIGGSTTVVFDLPAAFYIEAPESIQPGDEVTVEVKLTENEAALMGMTMAVVFDNTVLEFTGSQKGDLFTNMATSTKQINEGIILLSFLDLEIIDKVDYLTNGVLATLTFTAANTANGDATTITANLGNGKNAAFDRDENPVEILNAATVINLDYPDEFISVEITWGAMEFIYNNGTWNPNLLDWENKGWEAATENGNLITVGNTGTADVNLELGYASYTDYSTLRGKFKDGTNDVTGPIELVAGSEAVNYWFNLDGVTEERWTDEFIPVGSITIAIS